MPTIKYHAPKEEPVCRKLFLLVMGSIGAAYWGDSDGVWGITIIIILWTGYACGV